MTQRQRHHVAGIIGGVGSTAAVGVVALSLGDAKKWLDFIDAFLARPAALTITIVLVALLLGWLFVRSAGANNECERRVEDLTRQNAAQQAQLDAIHMLLCTDTRYGGLMPSLDAWRAGKFDVRSIISVAHDLPRRAKTKGAS